MWSMSISFRLGLGFHALNNEGADGSNLMQPRRIDVGEITYDGISGEIVRRHILENFVDICEQNKIPMFPLSAGLHPDRGPIGIRAAAKKLDYEILTTDCLCESAREAIKDCAILDIGGFLAAFVEEKAQGKEESSEPDQTKATKEKEGKKRDYFVEKQYIDTKCAALPKKGQGKIEPIKRESCFDVAWLISEEPQDLTITQHSAFRDTASLNDRYAQTMRSNIYGGVIRADLHRIGMDDHWYLLDRDRLAVERDEQIRRQQALVKAIVDFIASPTGAKTAGWSPHIFLTEGAILLTNARTAPFTSPIIVNLRNKENPVSANEEYRNSMQALNNDKDTWCWQFNDVKALIDAGSNVINQLNETKSNEQK